MPMLYRVLGSFRTPVRLAGAAAFAAAAATAASIHKAAHAKPIRLSAAEQEDVAAGISEKLSVPFVPRSLLDLIVSKVVQAILEELEKLDLDERTVETIQKAARMQSSGMDDRVLKKLVEDVCSLVDVPLLTKVQKRAIIEQTVAVAIGDTTLLQLAAANTGAAHVSFGRLILDPSSRKAVAKRLNNAVDFPGLNEEQEQVLFEAAIDFVGSSIDSFVPAEWHALLDGLDKGEIGQLKAAATTRLVESAPLPLRRSLSDEKLRAVIAAAVDGLFGALLRSDLGGAALGLNEQLDRLRRLEAEMHAEAAFLARRAQRDQGATARRLRALETQKAGIKAEMRRQQRWF